MAAADQYRVKAAELGARARNETNPILRAEFEALVMGYLRLAEQADRNSRNDISYETPKRDASRGEPAHQQQQQSQPKKDET